MTDSAPAPRNAPAPRTWPLSLALALLAAPFKLYGASIGYLNVHAARDWERGYRLVHFVEPVFHGSERSSGGVTPGYFHSILTGLFQAFGREPLLAAAGPAVLFSISVFFVHEAFRRFTRPWAALAATVLYALFPMAALAVRYLWNPSYLFLFLAVAFYAVARAACEERPNFMALGLAAVLLATHIHTSAWFLLGGLVAVAVAGRLWPTWRLLALVFAVQGALVVPFYFSDAANDWEASNSFTVRPPGERRTGFSWEWSPSVNWNLSRQVFVPNPDSEPNAHLTFSYYERRLAEGSPAFQGVARAASLLSLPVGVLAIAGLVAGSWVRRGPGRRRALLLVAYIAGAAGPPVLFYAFWDPSFGDTGRVNLQLRYFFTVWPLQFAGVAMAMDALGSIPHRLVRRVAAGTAWAWTAAAGLSFAAFTTLFMAEAKDDGYPFRYLAYEGHPVFTIRDLAAASNFLVTEYHIDETTMRRHVHSHPQMFFVTEQSLAWPMRAALAKAPPTGRPDPDTYFFLYRSDWDGQVVCRSEVVETRTFGALSVMVFRHPDLPDSWTPDYPVDNYFDRLD